MAFRDSLRQNLTGDWRVRILFTLCILLGGVLMAGLLLALIKEPGSTNSFALLADAFMHGRMDVKGCFDPDCATFADKTYVIFPPFPAFVAMPFVALFGVDFGGFIFLSAAAFAVSLFLWWRIFETMNTDAKAALWIILALAFATPLYYVTIRGSGVWFFAQSINFLLVTLAIHEVVRGGRLVLAGLCLGAAFLCRQMSIFLLPFLFALSLRDGEKLISFSKPHIMRALRLGLPVAGTVAIYLLYNHFRFGDPLETGYTYFHLKEIQDGNWISNRIHEHGLFSGAFFLFNLLYLLVQGLHVEFGGHDMLTLQGIDPWGTSLLAASPFVMLAIFAPPKRALIVGGLCAAVIIGLTLFYHGNGFSQYNVQRFVLDWLPVLIYALALAIRANLVAPFAVLATYAIGLNVLTMVVLALVTAS